MAYSVKDCSQREEAEGFGAACRHPAVYKGYALRQRCAEVVKRGGCPRIKITNNSGNHKGAVLEGECIEFSTSAPMPQKELEALIEEIKRGKNG